MRSLLRGWLRRGRAPDDPKPPPPPLPSLQPSNTESWTPTRQTQSLFFSLPSEIRHMILCAAFGDRTVHMDLRLRQGLVPQWPSSHGGHAPLINSRTGRALTHFDDAMPAGAKKVAWRWYGCVCHRNGPGQTLLQPCHDMCLQGFAFCHKHPGKIPDKCMVGAMGYLLSCKRALHEGSLVLYQTNIVFIESSELIDGLLRQGICPSAPTLTGPGVRLVRSLHLKFDFTLFSERDLARQARDRARLPEYLDLLPRAFPNLQRLELVFSKCVGCLIIPPPINKMRELEAVLFSPLMKAKAKMALDEFTVTIPEILFSNLMEFVPEWKSGEIPSCRNKADGFQGAPVWYPFDDGQGERTQPERGFRVKRGETGPFYWKVDGASGKIVRYARPRD